MPRRASASSWTFTKRLRSKAFGWRGSRLACERLREATSELRAAAAVDPIRAADGAVLLCERLTPALQEVDSSSGALGRAVNEAVAVAVELVRSAPATVEVRRRWLERLYEVFTDDSFGFFDDLGESWGELCVDDALANEWLEVLLPHCRANVAEPPPRPYYSGMLPCLSVLQRLGRHDVLVDLLGPLSSNHPLHRQRAASLAALGRVEEALAAAIAALPVDLTLPERILREAGRVEDAWRRYGRLRIMRGSAVAHFRQVVADYPTLPPVRLLRDLVETSPGDEAIWLACAVELGEHELAIELVQKSPANLATVHRIAKQQLDRAPRLVHAITLQTLRWIEGGRRGGATVDDVRDLVVGMLAAAKRLGLAQDEVVRSITALIEGAGENSLLAKLGASLVPLETSLAAARTAMAGASADALASGPRLVSPPADAPASGPRLVSPPADAPASGPRLVSPPADASASGPRLAAPSTAAPTLGPRTSAGPTPSASPAAASRTTAAPATAPTPASPLGISVSATFLAFLQPILDEVNEHEATRAALLQVASLAWNVVVFADDRGDASALAACRASLPQAREGALFDWLVERRRREFGTHRWLVRDAAFVVDGAGQLRLRVEAGR